MGGVYTASVPTPADFIPSGEATGGAVTVLGISVLQAPATVTTYGPADGVKVSVIMLPNSGI